MHNAKVTALRVLTVLILAASMSAIAKSQVPVSSRYLESFLDFGLEIDISNISRNELTLTARAGTRGPSGGGTLECTKFNNEKLANIKLDIPARGKPSCAQPSTYFWLEAMRTNQITCLGFATYTLSDAYDRFYGPTYPSINFPACLDMYKSQRGLTWLDEFVRHASYEDVTTLGQQWVHAAISAAEYFSNSLNTPVLLGHIGKCAVNNTAVDFERNVFCNLEIRSTADRRRQALQNIATRGLLTPFNTDVKQCEVCEACEICTVCETCEVCKPCDIFPPMPPSPPPPIPTIGCPASAVVNIAGPFTPTEVNERIKERFVLPSANSLTLAMTVTRDSWKDIKPGQNAANHSLAWLHLVVKDKITWKTGMLGFMNVFPIDVDTARLNLKVSRNGRLKSVSKKGVEFATGVPVKLKYSYNWGNGKAKVEFGGKSIVISGELPGLNGVLQFAVGHSSEDDGPEVVTTGWTYSDMCVEVE